MMQVIQETPATQLASLPIVQERFIGLLARTQGLSMQDAEMAYHQEVYHFSKALSENEDLRKCEPLSLYGAFCDCAVQGLSFDPKKKLSYLMPGRVNIGGKYGTGTEKYVWRASLTISPYGELAMRQKQRQILYADNPVVVYEGDEFEVYQDGSGAGIHYKLNPKHQDIIIACFIRIVRIDGSTDYQKLMKEDWERLAGYSAKKNNGKANALYSSGKNGQIDSGFLKAKMIKHAFNSYPKVAILGQMSQMADLEAPELPMLPKDIYGLDMPGAMSAPAQIMASSAEDTAHEETISQAEIASPAQPEPVKATASSTGSTTKLSTSESF